MITARLLAITLGAVLLLGAAPPGADVAVMVLSHAVEPQDQLSASDFAEAAMPPASAHGALGLHDVAGMEVARRLASGSIVRASDIIRPQLVRRGEAVTIVVRQGTLVISTLGRALTSGAAGAGVRVVTASTSRTLDGIVDGPGAVRVVAN